MVFVTDYRVRKVYNYLSSKYRGSGLFIFQHGLGDLMFFLPMFNRLREDFPKWNLKIGSDPRRGFDFLGEKIYEPLVPETYRTTVQKFTHVFDIHYPEPPHTDEGFTVKPYLCNEKELGIPHYIWSPANLGVQMKNDNSNLVGCHFFGNTNSFGKNPTEVCARRIWSEVKEAGYTPFEVHMVHHFTKPRNKKLGYSFFNSSNSLRFDGAPSIKKILNKITECKYFIGVDSGPLYLAATLLGFDKVIGLERYLKIDRYTPIKFPKINVAAYSVGVTVNYLKKLEEGNGNI